MEAKKTISTSFGDVEISAHGEYVAIHAGDRGGSNLPPITINRVQYDVSAIVRPPNWIEDANALDQVARGFQRQSGTHGLKYRGWLTRRYDDGDQLRKAGGSYGEPNYYGTDKARAALQEKVIPLVVDYLETDEGKVLAQIGMTNRRDYLKGLIGAQIQALSEQIDELLKVEDGLTLGLSATIAAAIIDELRVPSTSRAWYVENLWQADKRETASYRARETATHNYDTPVRENRIPDGFGVGS